MRVRYGYRRLHVLLRREGWAVNHKRVYRLYREEGLSMRRKVPRRRAACQARTPRATVGSADQVWAMDFVTDVLADGRRYRVLAVLDLFTRECLALRAGFKLTGGDVVAVLDELKTRRGVPGSIRVDNGPEFAGRTLDLWAYFNGVALDFSRPGKPTDNAFIESFNGRLRQECLNPRWFLCLDDARVELAGWQREYNADRPHSALGNLAPGEFAARQAGSHGAEPGRKSLIAGGSGMG
jgi:putative transposase